MMPVFPLLSILMLGAVAFWCLPKHRTFFPAPKAFSELEGVIIREYAYFDRTDFDRNAWLSEFEKRATQAKTPDEFRDIAQAFLKHFCDPHLNLGPFDEDDFSVIPTGSDMWAQRTAKGTYVISDVKTRGAAHLVGIRPGDELLKIDNLTASDAINAVLSGSNNLKLTKKQLEYAINVALGGKRNKPRAIELQRQGRVQLFRLPSSYESSNQSRMPEPVSYALIENQIAYIRFNNSLGNQKTVEAFARAMRELQTSKALIVDLRDTPSGGNTSVAAPILGHFTPKPKPYQRYRTQTREQPYLKADLQTAWTKPSEPQYENTVLVLVGRWTGSMGEGMAIGFDSFGAQVMGSAMAHLLGGIRKLDLPTGGAWLEFGFDRMYHVNGSFREDFIPSIEVEAADIDTNGTDATLSKALDLLRSN